MIAYIPRGYYQYLLAGPLGFSRGFFRCREIAGYPNGIMIIEKVPDENARHVDVKLAEILAGIPLPGDGIVFVETNDDITILDFNKNGDLLISYNVLSSDYDFEFVMREIEASNELRKMLLNDSRLVYYWRRIGRTIDQRKEDISTGVAEFLFLSENGEAVGFAKLENRQRWLNVTNQAGAFDWLRPAFVGIRDRILVALKKELGVRARSNYPKLPAAEGALVPYANLMFLVTALGTTLEVNGDLLADVQSFQRIKWTKLSTETWYHAIVKDLAFASLAERINLRTWSSTTEFASAIVVLGFDLFLYAKSPFPPGFVPVSPTKFHDLISPANLELLADWLPSRDEVKGYDDLYSSRIDKSLTNISMIEKMANIYFYEERTEAIAAVSPQGEIRLRDLEDPEYTRLAIEFAPKLTASQRNDLRTDFSDEPAGEGLKANDGKAVFSRLFDAAGLGTDSESEFYRGVSLLTKSIEDLAEKEMNHQELETKRELIAAIDTSVGLAKSKESNGSWSAAKARSNLRNEIHKHIQEAEIKLQERGVSIPCGTRSRFEYITRAYAELLNFRKTTLNQREAIAIQIPRLSKRDGKLKIPTRILREVKETIIASFKKLAEDSQSIGVSSAILGLHADFREAGFFRYLGDQFQVGNEREFDALTETQKLEVKLDAYREILTRNLSADSMIRYLGWYIQHIDESRYQKLNDEYAGLAESMKRRLQLEAYRKVVLCALLVDQEDGENEE